MKAAELLIHLLDFLLLPGFMGLVVALFAKLTWARRKSYFVLVVVGILGSLLGLIMGWMITGQDGRMLNYTLSAGLCALFVTVGGQRK